MPRTGEPTVAAYLAAQPAPARSVLAKVRATILKALPGATERISYQIPTYDLDGAMVLYFAGFRAHWSIYPATSRLLRELKDDLADHLHGKGTLRFSYDERFPGRLVTRIAKVRAAEAADHSLAKRAARKRR